MKILIVVLIVLWHSAVYAEVYDSGPVHGDPEHVHIDVPLYKTPKATFTPYIAKTFKDVYNKGDLRVEIGFTGRADKSVKDYFNDGTVEIKTGLEF